MSQFKELNISTIINPDDKKYNGESVYNYGVISLMHQNIFARENEIMDYDNWFVNFIEKNKQLLIDEGVEEFEIFIEVYFSGQCNFEIFDRENLSKLSKSKVALPISVYSMTVEEMGDLLK